MKKEILDVVDRWNGYKQQKTTNASHPVHEQVGQRMRTNIKLKGQTARVILPQPHGLLFLTEILQNRLQKNITWST